MFEKKRILPIVAFCFCVVLLSNARAADPDPTTSEEATNMCIARAEKIQREIEKQRAEGKNPPNSEEKMSSGSFCRSWDAFAVKLWMKITPEEREKVKASEVNCRSTQNCKDITCAKSHCLDIKAKYDNLMNELGKNPA